MTAFKQEETLQLQKDWRIAVDVDNYILQKRRIGERGKSKGVEIWDDYAYCNSLESVMSTAADYLIRENWPDLNRIIKLISEIRDICTQFKRL